MKILFVLVVERGIDDVDRRLRVPPLPKDNATINVMQEVVEFIRLVGEPTVVVKDVTGFPAAFWFWGDTYWGGRIVSPNTQGAGGYLPAAENERTNQVGQVAFANKRLASS